MEIAQAPTKCLSCEWPADEGSALCSYHRKQLEKIEAQILTNATRVIRSEMRQFERLMLIEPPLHPTEIAFRMVWPLKKVRETLRKFKDDRGG